MIVDCAHYRDGLRQTEAPMSLEEATAICRGEGSGFVWLGVFDPTPDDRLARVWSRLRAAGPAVPRAELDRWFRGSTAK